MLRDAPRALGVGLTLIPQHARNREPRQRRHGVPKKRRLEWMIGAKVVTGNRFFRGQCPAEVVCTSSPTPRLEQLVLQPSAKLIETVTKKTGKPIRP